MKVTLLFSNVANFRGDTTMDFWKYWNHSLTLNPPDNKERLEEMVSLVKEHDADIVGMTEVDKCAHWSGRIDQPKYLADSLGFNYAYGPNYFSPAPLIYTAETGNATLSRFKINKFESGSRKFKHRNLYEKFTAPFIGAKEFMHTVHYLPNGRKLHAVCTHLSTNFRKLREKNALDLVAYFDKHIVPLNRYWGDAYLLMADLNTVPLYTQKKHGFEDDSWGTDDYRKDYTLHILKHPRFFKSTMAIDPFDANANDDHNRYATYPRKPNRMIDYIFVSPDVKTSDIETIEVGFSDHRVIKTVVEIPD